MPTLLQIAQLGHPILRSKSKLVKNVSDPKVQALISDMLATVKDASGLGISAPQVYHSYRIMIIASHPNQRYPNAPHMEPLAMINPKILRRSQKKFIDWEGCLSIPGLRGHVPRWQWVEVEYTDINGKKHIEHYSDLIARIFQHELDHLDGLVFVDRVKSSRDLITDKEFMRILSGNN